jgi:hypothetical protein
MQLFVNGRAIDITNERVLHLPDPGAFTKPQDNGDPQGERLANICVEHTIDVNCQETTVVMTTFSLRVDKVGKVLKVPATETLQKYLGIDEASGKDTKRLWNSCQIQEQDSISAIASCVELILSVCSIPLPQERLQMEEGSTRKDKEGDGNQDSEQNPVTTDQTHTPHV